MSALPPSSRTFASSFRMRMCSYLTVAPSISKSYSRYAFWPGRANSSCFPLILVLITFPMWPTCFFVLRKGRRLTVGRARSGRDLLEVGHVNLVYDLAEKLRRRQ